MSPNDFALSEGFENEELRRKRLGQYYTDMRLARFLAILAGASSAKTILDPMGGRGDMIKACFDMGSNPLKTASIEIDPIAHEEGLNDLNKYKTKSLLGNAFDKNVLRNLPTNEWDLVITNPPYVRYQTFSNTSGNTNSIPNAKVVRQNLLDSINNNPALDEEDKRLFSLLTKNYSGLADLAVPAWLLCASQVKIGGTLAMVLPESWLTRDYVDVINYMLMRWFKIKHLVEDAHAVWFSNIQVKTILLVAERIPRKDTAFSNDTNKFLYTKIFKESMTDESIVGNIKPKSKSPERTVSNILNAAFENGEAIDSCFFQAKSRAINSLEIKLYNRWKKFNWAVSAESKPSYDQGKVWLGNDLEDWVDKFSRKTQFVTLSTLNIGIGQGLRTGANKFFYAEKNILNSTLVTSLLADSKTLSIPESCLKPVIRKQSDLPTGYRVKASNTKGRVLYFDGHALIEDIAATSPQHARNFRKIPENVSQFIRAVEKINVGTENAIKYLPNLSAVSPNCRKETTSSPPRFWYMLPLFSDRHMPDILIPRVNNNRIKAFLNNGRKTVIDANFSSVWLKEKSEVTKFSLLAFLNSSWTVAFLESTASVMGGGALKVEASHIREIPIPKLNSQKWKKMDELGRLLADSGGLGGETIIVQIDDFLASALAQDSYNHPLTDLANNLIKKRKEI